LIGLATEIHAHRKAGKAVGQKSAEMAASSRLEDTDEPPAYEGPTDTDGNLTPGSVDRPLTIEPLPRPVILPQRRPNSKSRGFVRAYAPDLWYYKGIDQQTFLAFLKDFHTSSQASPVFQVVNVAAMAAGFAPSAIAMAVSAAVVAASRAAIEVQGRYRTNNYLDKANEELFHPRKLHCMIMTFKPEAQNHVLLNFSFQQQAFSDAPAASSSTWQNITGQSGNRLAKRLRTSDGTTEGELAIPEAAPLIFPDPSSPEESSTEEGSDQNVDGPSPGPRPGSSSWKSTREFVSDYRDRRAQAAFAGEHGQKSKLVVPGAADSGRFASRFSDPNHPVNTGSPLALSTGGVIESPDHIKAKLAQLTGRSPTASPADQLKAGVKGLTGQQRRSRPSLFGGIKGMMQQDVLYLLIGEIPSDEEMIQLTGETAKNSIPPLS
jgi:hypothetical protein